jgi:hypothetical protein
MEVYIGSIIVSLIVFYGVVVVRKGLASVCERLEAVQQAIERRDR